MQRLLYKGKLLKLITFLSLLTTLAFSKVYYSKVEPYEFREISSNVSGVVLFIDENALGKKLADKAFIEIDAELDRDELHFSKEKIAYLEKNVLFNEKVLQNLEQSLAKKRENYNQIKDLKIKSRIEKDREFHDLVNSENSYLATQKEIISLKTQIADLKLRVAQLQRSIKDKNLKAEGFVLYSLDVKVGQVVAPGTPLAKIANTSKAILSIYLDEEDVKDAKEMVVYIDGKKSPYKIARLLKISDSTNISKYKAQIIIDAPEIFSKLLKIELKKESEEQRSAE